MLGLKIPGSERRVGKGGGNRSCGRVFLEASSAPPPVWSLPPSRASPLLSFLLIDLSLGVWAAAFLSTETLTPPPPASLPPPAHQPFFSASVTSFLSFFLPSVLKKITSPRRRSPSFLGKEKEAERVSAGNLSFFAAMNVDHEVNLLVEEIHRLGSKNADGKLSVKFGVLFRDDKCANLFEALVGTLKAAKRRKMITYPGELLLQGVHDDVDIILLQD
eukprot:bmy_01787T0